MTRNAVPWKAVKILNTKNDARFGASAVPILKPVNSVALATDTCKIYVSLPYSSLLILSAPRIKPKTYPFSPIYVSKRPIKAWTQPHKQHVQRIRDIDNRAIGAKLRRHLGHCRQHRRRRYRGQETAERDDRYDDGLAPVREAVIDLVRIARHHVAHVGHVMVVDARDRTLEFQAAIFRDDGRELFLSFWRGDLRHSRCGCG
jgi:hypothetical protein